MFSLPLKLHITEVPRSMQVSIFLKSEPGVYSDEIPDMLSYPEDDFVSLSAGGGRE